MFNRLFSTAPVFFGIAFATAALADNTPRVYREFDNRIIASQGDTFIIKIPSNPTTGFTLRIGDLRFKNVELLKQEFTRNCPPMVAGCGGFQNFFFKVVKKGTDDIVITSGRSWEPSSNHDFIFRVISPFTIEDRDFSISPTKMFTLKIPENPTTGFKINLVEPGRIQSVRFLDNFYVSSCTRGMVGCGGFEYFTFKGVQLGTSELRFTYARPWEHEPPVRTFDFRVHVHAY